MKGYWYFLVLMEKETHTYIPVLKSYESEALQQKSRDGCNHPPSGDVLQKIAQVDED